MRSQLFVFTSNTSYEPPDGVEVRSLDDFNNPQFHPYDSVVIHAPLTTFTEGMFTDVHERVLIHIVPSVRPSVHDVSKFEQRTVSTGNMFILHLKEMYTRCNYDHVIIRHHNTNDTLLHPVVREVLSHEKGTGWDEQGTCNSRFELYKTAIRDLGDGEAVVTPFGSYWMHTGTTPELGHTNLRFVKGLPQEANELLTELTRKRNSTGTIVVDNLQFNTATWLQSGMYFQKHGKYYIPVNIYWLFIRFGDIDVQRR